MERDHSPPRGSKRSDELLREVRLIGKDGTESGKMILSEAVKIADGQSAKLLSIAPNAQPPIYRMIDKQKYREMQEKRRRKEKNE